MTWERKIPKKDQYVVIGTFANYYEGREPETLYFGPFSTEEEATQFMNDYPDDKDMIEMESAFMNEVENTTDVEAF